MKEYLVVTTKVVHAENPRAAVEQSAAIVPSEVSVKFLGQTVLYMDYNDIKRYHDAMHGYPGREYQ